MFVCMCLHVCMYTYVCSMCIFTDVVFLLNWGTVFRYNSMRFSRISQSGRIFQFAYTTFHIFKIWNYDCVWNNIFKCPNDIFRCFVGLTIASVHFGILEWDFLGFHKKGKQFSVFQMKIDIFKIWIYDRIEIVLQTKKWYLSIFFCSCNYKSMLLPE